MALPLHVSPLAHGVDASPNKQPQGTVGTQRIPDGLAGRFASKDDMRAQLKRFLVSSQEKDMHGSPMSCQYKTIEKKIAIDACHMLIVAGVAGGALSALETAPRRKRARAAPRRSASEYGTSKYQVGTSKYQIPV